MSDDLTPPIVDPDIVVLPPGFDELEPEQQDRVRLRAYYAAEEKILKSQEYQVGDGVVARRNVRPELIMVRSTIELLIARIATYGQDRGPMFIV